MPDAGLGARLLAVLLPTVAAAVERLDPDAGRSGDLLGEALVPACCVGWNESLRCVGAASTVHGGMGMGSRIKRCMDALHHACKHLTVAFDPSC